MFVIVLHTETDIVALYAISLCVLYIYIYVVNWTVYTVKLTIRKYSKLAYVFVHSKFNYVRTTYLYTWYTQPYHASVHVLCKASRTIK